MVSTGCSKRQNVFAIGLASLFSQSFFLRLSPRKRRIAQILPFPVQPSWTARSPHVTRSYTLVLTLVLTSKGLQGAPAMASLLFLSK